MRKFKIKAAALATAAALLLTGCEKTELGGTGDNGSSAFDIENNSDNSSGLIIEDGVLKEVSPELTEAVIPDEVTVIENAFSGCSELTSVVLPDGVAEISENAFDGCANAKITYKDKIYGNNQFKLLYRIINEDKSETGFALPFETYSKGVYMVNLDTGFAVVSQNADEILYPASITKIMTCIVALENVIDLNAPVIAPYDECFAEFWGPNPNFIGASAANIQPEQNNLTYLDCLYGLMLSSGCEAANIIAYNAGGNSIERFVEMMNDTAQKIGCKNTHFTNAHGLFEEENYTTAYDMYLITKYGIDNIPLFSEICNSFQYEMPANSAASKPYTITNINRMINPKSDYYYEGAANIKTGSINEYYLKQVDGYDEKNPVVGFRTMVTTAERNGSSYMVVTLGAPYVKEQTPYLDHTNLYNWSFESF